MAKWNSSVQDNSCARMVGNGVMFEIADLQELLKLY